LLSLTCWGDGSELESEAGAGALVAVRFVGTKMMSGIIVARSFVCGGSDRILGFMKK
jgi:hypothetical protein